MHPADARDEVLNSRQSPIRPRPPLRHPRCYRTIPSPVHPLLLRALSLHQRRSGGLADLVSVRIGQGERQRLLDLEGGRATGVAGVSSRPRPTWTASEGSEAASASTRCLARAAARALLWYATRVGPMMTDGNKPPKPQDGGAKLTSGDLADATSVRRCSPSGSRRRRSRAERPERHGAGDRRRDGHARRAHGAAEGLRRAGFVFYTNLESRKGRQLAAIPKAALCFHWKSLRRQVRVRGPVEPVTRSGGRRLFRHAPAAQPDRRLGLRSRGRSRAASRWRRRWRCTRRATPSATCRARRTGRASASRREIEFWRDRAFRLHDRLRFSAAGWRLDEGVAVSLMPRRERNAGDGDRFCEPGSGR